MDACTRAHVSLDIRLDSPYARSMARQLIVELGEALARELERAAPARSRRRSSFIRAALRRALDELVETRMAEAYKAQSDVEPAHFDARLWEPTVVSAR